MVRAQDGAFIELDRVDIRSLGSSQTMSAEGLGSTINANGVDIRASTGRGMVVSSGSLTFSNGSINAREDGITLEQCVPAAGRRGGSQQQPDRLAS